VGGLVLSVDFTLVPGLGEFLVTGGKDGRVVAEKFVLRGDVDLRTRCDTETSSRMKKVIHALDFATAWKSCVELEFDGMVLPFLDRESLRKNKLATGRTQDLTDAEEFERIED
jgi:hypothetical protein